MKIKKELYIQASLIFIFIFSLSCPAQINPVYKIMKQRGWYAPVGAFHGKLTFAQMDTELLSSMGYNDTAVANLKKIEVDLLGLHGRQKWTDKVFAALSDCIVIGTVEKIEHPFGERSWFHTVAYVQVEEFLRNDYNLSKGLIPILIVPGPAGTRFTVIANGEDTLGIGDHVLLYLDASGLIVFASENHMNELYNYLVNDSKIQFEKIAMFNIIGEKAFSHSNVRDLEGLRLDIKEVLNAVHVKLKTDKKK